MGLVLMGHRYYDVRIGRFLTADPAGDGDNWYAYADNDPINEDDPEGLISQGVNGGSASLGGPMAAAADLANFDAGFTVTEYTHHWMEVERGYGSSAYWEHVAGSDTYTPVESTTYSMGAGMIAGDAGENVANFFKAIAPFLPGKVHKPVGVVKDTIEAVASAKAASAAFKTYLKHKSEARAWSIAAKSLSRYFAVRAAGSLGVAVLGTAGEAIFAASAGWEVGTAISDAPLGPGGQTVTDFWTDQASNSGAWMQQHTTFGH